MHVRLLGRPLVLTPEAEVPVRSARQAVVLGALALGQGQVVPVETLMDALWDDAPRSARNAVQVHVSGLRRLVGPGVVESAPGGYRMPADTVSVDATVFRSATGRAEALAASGQWLAANRSYRSALALWQGTALGGLTGRWASSHRDSLDRQRLAATRGRFRSDLELGHHLAVVDEVRAALQQEPYDEELVALLMVALYRAGRVADALAAFREARRRLVDDLGVEPGSTLADLHRAVLARDPSLDLDPASAVLAVPTGVRRRGALVGRALTLARLTQLVRGDAGPITLVGPPGVGKSRLAAELTGRMQAALPDGVAVLDCEQLTDVVTVPGLVATQFGLDLLGDPRQTLRAARGLLVLDGVRPQHPEHAALVDLVDSLSMPVVATAHRPCGWAHEQVVPVRPLETESPDGDLSPATELLLLRAAAAGAPAVGEDDTGDAAACARLLDGVPLALELAAPRALLGFAELRADLEREQERHRAGLRLSFAASLHGRDDQQLRLLHVLARSGGPVDTGWLRLVPGLEPDRVLDALAALVRDGLAREVTGAQDRAMFELLDGVRAEVLAGEDDDDRRWTRSVVTAHDLSIGQHCVMLSVLPSVKASRRRAALLPSAEHALVAALELGMYDEAARVAYAIGELMLGGGAIPRQVWLHLSRPEVLAGMPPATRLAALVGTGDWASESAGHTALMVRVADEAVALAREAGSAGDLAIALTKHLAWCHVNGRTCEASDEEALAVARDCGDDAARCATEMFGGCLRGDPELLRGSLEAARQLGHAGLTALALANLSEMRLSGGDATGAADLASEALGLYVAMRVPLMQQAMASSLSTARALSGSSAGLGRVADLVTTSWENENPRLVTDVLLKLGCGFRARGSPELAARAVGVYRAYLASRDLEVAEDEHRLLDQWLGDVVPVRPDGALSEEVAALVAAAHRAGP